SQSRAADAGALSGHGIAGDRQGVQHVHEKGGVRRTGGAVAFVIEAPSGRKTIAGLRRGLPSCAPTGLNFTASTSTTSHCCPRIVPASPPSSPASTNTNCTAAYCVG